MASTRRRRAGLPAIRVLRTCGALLLSVLALAAVPAVVSAHPLGNFTINHYSGLRVQSDRVLVDHVLDMAEIPAFQERQSIDTDGDSQVSPAEASAYESATCPRLADSLELSANGARLPLTVIATGLAFPPGQVGLVTLRLVCVYEARLAAPITAATDFTFRDSSYAERIGWREAYVEGDAVTIATSDASTRPVSARLTSYPKDLLAQPLDQRQVTFVAIPGGTALPPWRVDDASPIGATGVAAPGPSVVPGGSSAARTGGTVPGGIALPRELEDALSGSSAGLPILLLAVALAALVGAGHAVQPGHGKTIMAAYLVGTRGNTRHAVLLGLTVTLSHTLNVLVLAAIVTFAASLLPSDRVFAVLTLVSALMIVALGVYLVLDRVRVTRRRRRESAIEALAAQPHDHEDHGHEHPHGPAEEHAHEHPHGAGEQQVPTGWHSHGGTAHTHLPARPGQPLTWRTLVLLGIAGGLVPAPEAVFLLLGSIAAGRVAFGLVLIVSFGVGMAVVMTAIGLALVYARGMVERLPRVSGLGRLAQAVPLVTAVLVLGVGVTLTAQALQAARF